MAHVFAHFRYSMMITGMFNSCPTFDYPLDAVIVEAVKGQRGRFFASTSFNIVVNFTKGMIYLP